MPPNGGRAQRRTPGFGDETGRPPAEVLDAAAEICAEMLLSGAAGCSLGASRPDDDYPALDRFRPADGSLVRAALATRLFTAPDPDPATDADARQFTPSHRQLAEFLGARHLAGRIAGGLPVGRVFALMMAPDGAAPTPLRGLAAWLRGPLPPGPGAADRTGSRRNRGLRRDPRFLTGRKTATPGPGPRSGSKSSTPDACPRTRCGPSRFPIWPRRSGESSNRRGARMPTRLSPASFSGPWRSANRCRNLRTSSSGSPATRRGGPSPTGGRWTPSSTTAVMRRRAGRARADSCTTSAEAPSAIPDRELLGTLLARMVPEEIPPDELWNFLLDQPDELVGRYFVFWRRDLFEKTPEERLPDLLEALGARLPGLRPALRRAIPRRSSCSPGGPDAGMRR